MRVAGFPGELVVIDADENEAVRTDDVIGQLKTWILRKIDKGEDVWAIGLDGGYEIEVTRGNIDELLPKITKEDREQPFNNFLVTKEGGEGVAMGYAGPTLEVGPWPEIGNDLSGEAYMVYKTTDTASGQPVKGVETERPLDDEDQ